MAKAKREYLNINDVICMWDNARTINQFGRYDVTCLVAPEQIKDLMARVNQIVKAEGYPETIEATYKLPNDQEVIIRDNQGNPIVSPGYNKPYNTPKAADLDANPEIKDMLVLKASSKFAPKAYVKDTPTSAPRAMGVQDAQIEGRGTIISLCVGINTYDGQKDGKRSCGVSLFLEQILYTGNPCGFELQGGGESGACAWQ